MGEAGELRGRPYPREAAVCDFLHQMNGLPAHDSVLRARAASAQLDGGGPPPHGPLGRDGRMESTRIPERRVRTSQAPMPDAALLAGLEALGRALARRDP